jgi:hypothetical protein
MKNISIAVAVLSCVMLTSLLSRAEDKEDQKETSSYLLRIRLSDSLIQEIKVEDRDDFDVSTTVGGSQLSVGGTTQLEGTAMWVRKLNIQWHRKEPAGTKQIYTSLALPLDGTEVTIGGGTVITTKDGVKTEETIRASIQKFVPQSKELTDPQLGRRGRRAP